MTDAMLIAALADTNRIESQARAYWQAAPDVEEQQAALEIVRQVTAVHRLLEKWQAARLARTVRA